MSDGSEYTIITKVKKATVAAKEPKIEEVKSEALAQPQKVVLNNDDDDLIVSKSKKLDAKTPVKVRIVLA